MLSATPKQFPARLTRPSTSTAARVRPFMQTHHIGPGARLSSVAAALGGNAKARLARGLPLGWPISTTSSNENCDRMSRSLPV